MGSKRIAFQGEPGAYSEEALFLLHPDAESRPYREFRDVAQAVVERRVDLGPLPIENSLVGSIATNFDLIAESGLAIVGEVVSAVHHCLLGLPGATRDSLRRVLSHPVALAQCERFLRELVGVEVVAFYDTAGAAAGVARGATDLPCSASGWRTSHTTRRGSCSWRGTPPRRRPAWRRRRRSCSSCPTGPGRWRARSPRSPSPA